MWHTFARSRTVLLAQATAGVGPFEASGQNVADIAEVEKEERHPYYCVHYSRDFAPFRSGTNVAVTCAVNENAASEFIDELRCFVLGSVSCFIHPVRELIYFLLIYCPRCFGRDPSTPGAVRELLIERIRVIKIFIPREWNTIYIHMYIQPPNVWIHFHDTHLCISRHHIYRIHVCTKV